MKLFHKFNLALILVSLISAFSLSFIFFRIQKKTIMDAEKEKIEILIQGVKNIISEAVLAKDYLMIIDYLTDMRKRHPEIIGIRLNIAGKWNEVEIPENIRGHQKSDSPKISNEKSMNVFTKEIWLQNIGVRIYFSSDYIKNEQNQNFISMTKNLFIALLIAVTLATIVALLLSFSMTRRLGILSKYVQEIGAGKFGQTISVQGNDEIGELAKNFNLMSLQLRELEEMKKTFVSSITHELRSPLGVIESYINMFLNSPKKWTKGEIENFKRIKENASRLSNFVTTLLDISRIERGKMELNLQLTDIKSLVEDVVSFFLPKAKEKNINLTTEIKTDVCQISVDPVLIGHVLTNLISNAIKFTPSRECGDVPQSSGNINVELSKTEENYIRISVTDSGKGIPETDLPRLFLPFERGKNVLEEKGTGLGLALAKGIVQLHKGRIGVNSIEGKGSTFWFEIPA